jgi:hypothetical protein
MGMNPSGLLLTLSLALAGTAAGQEPSRRVRLATPNFVFARYATVSASSMYVGYTLGAAAAVLGMVINPRTGYRELIGGAVTRVAWGRQSANLALALADAPEGEYLQAYLVPSLVAAGVSVSGTLELYQPLVRTGTTQLDLNPVSLTLRLGEWVGIGGCYTLGLASGAPSRQRAGPTLQLQVPRGSLRVELLRNVARSAPEVRMSFEAAF